MKPSQQWRLFAEQIRARKPDRRFAVAGVRPAMEQAAKAAEKVADELDKEEQIDAWCDSPV